jgi:maleylacetoacetate isomerase
MRLRLHTRFQNSAGQRIRIVLNLKGIGYEYVPVPSVSAPEYVAINPQGLLPALEIDGQIVAQSMAIFELLEELFPEPPMLPEAPLRRAQARAFAQSIVSDLHPINNNRVRKYLAADMGLTDERIQRWYRHWVAVTFAGLESGLASGPQTRFAFGDRPGLADACLVPQMDNARRFSCPLDDYPRLKRIDAECRTLAAFRDAAPEVQPDYPGA